MATERTPRDRQRGNSLVLALIVMSALATLGSLTVVSVQSSLKASTNDRSTTVALYAAESGAAYAMDFLKANPSPLNDWTPYFNVNNVPAFPSKLFPTNRAPPGSIRNPFTIDQNAWFDIQFFNDRVEGPSDANQRVIIRSTGHGPQESVAVVEWEVRMYTPPPNPNPNPPVFVLIGWHVIDL